MIQYSPTERTTNVSMYSWYNQESVNIYPTIPIFLDSICTCKFIPKTTTPPIQITEPLEISNFPSYINSHRMQSILEAQNPADDDIPYDIFGNHILNPLYQEKDMKLLQIGKGSIKGLKYFIAAQEEKWKIIIHNETNRAYSYTEPGKISIKSVCTLPFTPLEVYILYIYIYIGIRLFTRL